MKMIWEKYINFEVNVSLKENFGVVTNESLENPFYEVSFKVGTLIEVNEYGLLIQSSYQKRRVESLVPFDSIKCIDFLFPEIN